MYPKWKNLTMEFRKSAKCPLPRDILLSNMFKHTIADRFLSKKLVEITLSPLKQPKTKENAYHSIREDLHMPTT